MTLSDEQMELFALEIGAEILLVEPGQQEEIELQALFDDTDDDENQQPRAPVVTVMGHVDHGKTTLLDKIRSANVVAGEAGGITQHIGAYQVVQRSQPLTFIDTPGHAAFTQMRARGAEATDIVVLVVAADDGVMPQTVEAINHARAAEVPIIVAMNKIDKDNADPQRVLNQLAEQGLVPESWGGDTIVVELSATQELGIDDLLEQLLVVAELEELTANPEGRAKGVVLESNLDVGRGPVATVLVDKGELSVGDPIVAGPAWGRVRAMLNDKGEQIKTAGPSTPVQVLGLSAVPAAGDEFRSAPDEKIARTVAEAREQRLRLKAQRGDARVKTGTKLEDIFSQIQSGETATLNLILKADVQGSLEAVTESLRKLDRPEVELTFVHRAVGAITENDITLAATTNATIIGFNVRPDRKARDAADSADVEIRTYEVIYKLLEEIEQAMVGMLAPEYDRGRHRRGRGPRDLPGAADRGDRRLLRALRCDHPRLEGSLPARRHDHLEGRDLLVEAVQGRRPRGPRGLRMRHRPVRLPGPQAGRPHRDLRRARDRPHLTGAAVLGGLRSSFPIWAAHADRFPARRPPRLPWSAELTADGAALELVVVHVDVVPAGVVGDLAAQRLVGVASDARLRTHRVGAWKSTTTGPWIPAGASWMCAIVAGSMRTADDVADPSRRRCGPSLRRRRTRRDRQVRASFLPRSTAP